MRRLPDQDPDALLGSLRDIREYSGAKRSIVGRRYEANRRKGIGGTGGVIRIGFGLGRWSALHAHHGR